MDDFEALETRLNARIDGLRAEMKADVAELRADTRTGLAELRTELHRSLANQVWKIAAIMIPAWLSSVGLALTIARLG